jgi:choline dehydrogenase-like flavoprotein
VVARTRGGGTLRVQADVVVVSCGALHTPLLLRANGVGGESGQLGRNLAIHPATGVRAFLDEDVEMWRGVPQSYYVDEFAGEGIMLEGAAGPPDYMAMSLPARGAELRELMLRFRHLSQFGVMVSDSSRGEVRRVLGRPVVRYDLNRRDTDLVKRGLEKLVEIYWAAGAREVMLPIRGMPTLRDGDSRPLRRLRVRAGDLQLMAFHPLGTARAGADPRRSVTDAAGLVHGVPGLYVADASVVPTALGVNPQITIMALATRMAFRLLDVAPPEHEPEPAHIPRPQVGVPAGAGA